MSSIASNIQIAIAGNPNCGKTTLFNTLTGSDQRVGNWPGVTVERIEGHLHNGDFSANIVDIPGIYTLIPDSEDEFVARKTLESGTYDLIINVVDATNLERNLFLTTELIDLKLPLLVVLNKIDLLEKSGRRIDTEKLSEALGVEVLAVSANSVSDVRTVVDKVVALCRNGDFHVGTPIPFPETIERVLSHPGIPEIVNIGTRTFHRRMLALAYLAHDEHIMGLLNRQTPELHEKITAAVNESVDEDFDAAEVLAASRYAYIRDYSGCISDTGSAGRVATRKSADDIILHRIWGIPIFFGVMYLVFLVTMTIGGAFIDFFDILAGALFVDGAGAALRSIGAPGWVTAWIADGIGGGIQTITTFIPIVFFMFFMLGILEDSGYMARAAYVMDRFMRFVGLPGKAFVPLLVGFGCSVPAIMATRTLERRRDRFLTIFMIPSMSCSARLPAYAIFAAAFFNRYAGLVVFSIYIAGILIAVLTGLIMKRTLFTGSFSPFIMELPAYSRPRLGMTVRNAWIRLKGFLFRAGKIIIIAVAILTVLSSLGMDGTFGNEDTGNSVLAGIGKRITPIFTPMGIGAGNWPATVGLFTGIFAKEAIVGTMNSLYATHTVEDTAEPAAGSVWVQLGGAVREAFSSTYNNFSGLIRGLVDPLGLGVVSSDTTTVTESVGVRSDTLRAIQSNFTPASAYAFMLFVLIYFPCLAAFGAAVRETGWFYGTLLAVYLTLLAWIVSVLFYQLIEGHMLFWIFGAFGMFAAVFATLWIMGSGVRKNRFEARAFL